VPPRARGRRAERLGISFGLTLQLIALSGDNLFLLLVLTAAISIILGMGMPTVSVYVLTATLLAPSLVKLGVTPMAAHMFVMYFGMLSMITPPVAIAAYAAANIARVPEWNAAGRRSSWAGARSSSIPLRARAEPADGRSAVALAWNLCAQPAGHLRRHCRGGRLRLLPASRAQRLLFGAAALAILIPQNAFPGAEVLDWLGLSARQR